MNFKTTKDIKVSPKIVDQIIGQDEAVSLIKKVAKQRRNLLLIGDPGTGKCVSSDAQIALHDGSTLSAEELFSSIQSKQVFVQSIDRHLALSFSKILKAKTTKQQTLKLTTNTGKKIKVSKEHPFLSIDKKGLNWKKSSKLKLGSYIATPRILLSSNEAQSSGIPNKIRYAPSPYHSNVKEITFPSEFSSELAEFLGYLWSEGYISRKKELKFTNSQLNLIERFECLANSLFNLKAKRRHFPEKNAYESTINSSVLAKIIYDLGWREKVPSKIMSGPLNVAAAFLRAYFDGDGGVSKKEFEVVSKEEKVITDMQALLLHFGILSIHKPKYKRATNSEMKPRLYHGLVIYDAENLSKLQKIGFSIPYKNARLAVLASRKKQSNIDKMPFLGTLLFELKEKLRLSSEEIGVGGHQFSRYLSQTEIPTRATVQKIVKAFAQRFVAIKSIIPKLTTDGKIDLSCLCGELRLSKHILTTRLGVNESKLETFLETRDSQLIPVLQQIMGELVSIEIERSLTQLYQIAFSEALWEKIVKIEEGDEEILYDFEVEGAHNFIANNIIVHNSMIGQALAELLPKEKLVDILSFPNPSDDNIPLIRVMPKGQGKPFVTKAKISAMSSFKNQNIILIIFVLIATFLPYYFYSKKIFPFDSPIIYAASMITSIVFIIGFMLFLNLGKRMKIGEQIQVPKLLIDNSKTKKAPFIEATGSHAGALLGDCLHDPLQSGGLGTPAYERLIPGMIHRANGGVLFIDEIATLHPHSQQELLSAMQEKKYPITGHSERSSGAMTRSEPVPCDFIMVAAGNLETVKRMHPALRSRIRGYGYEVYMNTTMDDSAENVNKIAVFVAQEVVKDGKIPHFTKGAVDIIVWEARKMASMAGKLTVRLRELGGLVRAAGDLALEEGAKFVESKHIFMAKKLARPLEQQLADKYIEDKKKYQVIITSGKQIGRVNGLAVIGSGSTYSGIVLPIESEVTLGGGKRTEFVATGRLGEIAKEAIKNVSAIILKYFGEDLRGQYDIFTQFIQSQEGVEGDSASIAVATSIISALKNVPVRQDTAMTGSLSVRGEVLAVGGVTAKVEAAIDAGIKRVIIPKANYKDLFLSEENLKKVKIIPVGRIGEVLEEALDWKGKKEVLKKIKSGPQK